ncbi:MAG: MerR family transcriptional regulator [Alistipes sp.]|nr:MerR family transcriptional regulator [Alistipes sp.]
MAEKLFYSMGEVAEMFDVKPSLLRYWEEQFPALKPHRNKKGNRLYSPQDVELLKTIFHLVKERGLTIEGAKKALRQERKEGTVARTAQLMERLQRIRSLLEAVREDLKGEGDGEEWLDEEIETVEPTETPTPDKGDKVVLKIEELKEEPAEPTEQKTQKPRRPRRKKDAEEKELFAFYEQSLF